MDRRRRAPSYEEDMTPPRGMRGMPRPEMVPTDEPMPGRRPSLRSFEEDMTPPRGMRDFRSNAVPTDEPMPGRPGRMAKGGAVKMKSGGVTRGDGCAARGKTKGRMV
jgi:hypothetical protein